MSKGNTFENELLQHIFENADVALIGDATGLRGSTTPGSLYISLHTADVGEAGDQTTNEVAYTGYAREGVTRAGASWTITNNQVTNANAVTFGQCTAGSATASHFAVGTDLSGTGKVLYFGALTGSLAISSGITPEFAIDAITITED